MPSAIFYSDGLLRCCSQDGGRMLGAADTGEPTPCKLELACEGKLGLGCGTAGSCVCPSSTQEVCASSSPPELLHVRGMGCPRDSMCKRERRNSSSGAGAAWSKSEPPSSPLPCLSLPFPTIPPPPGASPPPLLIPAASSNNSSLSSSPLSSVPSPTRLSALFGVARTAGSTHHHHHQKGSISITPTEGSSNASSGSSNNNIAKGSSRFNSGPLETPSPAATADSPGAVTMPTEETAVTCRWKACGSVVSPADLLDHLRIQHVDTQSGGETFVCEWEGCKVAGKTSCSMSWLERHVVAHGGHKPFKCILPNCGARFPSQVALQRHVNAHFATEEQSGNNRTSRPRGEDTSTRILRKRSKAKRRRPQCVRNGDFFDSGVMDQLRQQLWELTEKAHLDLNGSSNSVTFHSSVMAHRTDEAGKTSVLLHWTPEDILDDVWVPASQVDSQRQRVIPFSQLPPSTATNLHPSLYHRLRFRKHRRK